MKNKLIILVSFYVLSILQGSGQNNDDVYKKIRHSIKNLSSETVLSGGMVGFSLRDPNGKEVVSYNSEKALIPASNLKVITTATALKLLGPDFRFKTDIYITGSVVDGVLKGDVVIMGSGDPTLGGGRIAGNLSYEDLLNNWTSKIRETGIRKIEGRILQEFSCSDKNIIPGGWIWEDIGNYYGAGISGLNFNENLYTITFRPGKTVGDSTEIVRVEPEVPGLIIENNVRTASVGSGDNAWIFGSPYSNYRYISGTIPAGVNEFTIKGSLPDPPLLLVSLLSKALIKSGISVISDPISTATNKCILNPNAKLLFSHLSPSLKEIIEPTNKNSINLYAEALYKAAERKVSNANEDKSFMLDYWGKQSISTIGNFVLDGSGLSPRNAVQPSFISHVLSKISRDSLSSYFIESLPLSGVSGTLSKFSKGTVAERRVIAKSGSMARVIGYSGYLKSKNGTLYSFCILVNNYEGKTSEMVKRIEKLMIVMAEL